MNSTVQKRLITEERHVETRWRQRFLASSADADICIDAMSSPTTTDCPKSHCPSTAALLRVYCRPLTLVRTAIVIATLVLAVVTYNVIKTSPTGARYKEMDGDSVSLDAVSRSLPPLKSAWIRFTPPLIFYNRVPKCASQTILSLTKNLSRINNFTYQHSRVFQEYTIDESKQSYLCAKLNILQIPAIYDRHVHFINCTRFQMEMPTYMNIIRDPFERMVSFYYFRRFQAKLIEPLPDVDKNRSFDTCVLENYPECTEPYGDTHGFGYFQLIPFFCGHAAFCRKPTLNALETAIANVERYYSIIGVVEQFDQFLEALEVVFPDYFRGVTHIYKTAGKYKRKVNASIHKVKPTAKVRQIMREKLYLEYKFYYFVKWRFDKLYREIVSNRSTDVPSSDTYFN